MILQATSLWEALATFSASKLFLSSVVLSYFFYSPDPKKLMPDFVQCAPILLIWLGPLFKSLFDARADTSHYPSFYREGESVWVCVYIISKGVQGAHSKLGFAWFWPNWTSWSQFFVPGTIFESIWSIWTKNQISRPFRLEVTCIIGPYVFPFPILFYSIRDRGNAPGLRLDNGIHIWS